jgi:hypothetical protein
VIISGKLYLNCKKPFQMAFTPRRAALQQHCLLNTIAVWPTSICSLLAISTETQIKRFARWGNVIHLTVTAHSQPEERYVLTMYQRTAQRILGTEQENGRRENSKV